MTIKKNYNLNDLFKILAQFIEGRTGIFIPNITINPEIIHYYNEIIRYWNRLNFILKRITNHDKATTKLSSMKNAKYLYIIFRFYEENASLNEIIKEIGANNSEIRVINNLKNISFEKILKKKPQIEKLSLIYAYPTFLIKNLTSHMNIDFLVENLTQMNSYNPATDTFSFFINTLAMNTKDQLTQFFEDLEKEKIKVLPDKNLSNLYFSFLKNKKDLTLSEWYRSGKVIIVDKASVIVATLLNPNKDELISDLCAAPGIKSILLASLTNNASKIIALDFSYTRTKQMTFLLRNLSVSSAFILNSDGITPPLRTNIRFDRILIDAPCTGSGTLLSNPELKWRQNSNFLKQNMVLQTKLLNSAINFLKPGGVLLYSTCSLYAEEGELQILKFFDQLKPVELPKWISPSYKINGRVIPGTGRLFPSIHHTKGFFIGKFKKKE